MSYRFYCLPLYAFKQQNDVIKIINVYFSVFCSLFRFFLKLDIVLVPCDHAQWVVIVRPQSNSPNPFIVLKSYSSVDSP